MKTNSSYSFDSARTGIRLLVCSAALGLAVAAAQANTVLLDTGFENPPWGNETVIGSTMQNGWTGAGNSGTDGRVQLVSGGAHSGSQSLFLRDNVRNYIAWAGYSLGQTVQDGSLEFWMKKGSGTQETAGFYVNFFNTAGVENFRFSLGDSFVLGGTNGLPEIARKSLDSISGGDTLDIWNKITINYSSVSKTVEVLFNNEVVFDLSGAQLDGIDDLSIASFRFNSGYYAGYGDSAAWIDDVKFTAIPEPGSMGMLGVVALVVGIAALRCHGRK